MGKRKGLLIILLFFLLAGCTLAPPIRQEVKPDLSLPVGKIEGNQFTGIRYPFNVSAPLNWNVSMEFPRFMLDLGYDKEGLERSQVFIFNVSTRSNIQIDFEPAGQYLKASQQMIDNLTSMATGSLLSEFENEYGANYKEKLQLGMGPLEQLRLKGVPFAAKKYVTYNLKGMKREQGWIYAFAEPYQIFILYVLFDREGSNDRQDMRAILDSFEVVPKK
jgi:hypothetical protein